jgi:NTE family protein
MFKILTSFSTIILVISLPDFSKASDPSVDNKVIINLDISPSESYASFVSHDLEPGVGLALSGGGSRGLAHIGVLKVLDRENINIAFISGVSMGGIIGGLYSSGYSPGELTSIALDVRWKELFSQSPLRSSLLATQKDRSEKSLVKIRFDNWRPVLPRAITSGQNLNQFLEALTTRAGIRSSISFDYLDPPLRIICTDLSTGGKVILSSGNLAEAMRASMAVPVALTPVDIEGKLLVDGGLVDPIPVDIVIEKVGHPVLAVNTSSDLLPASRIVDVIDIADQTTTIMSMHRKMESLGKADLVIVPDLDGRLSTDFSDIRSLIEAGEKAAEKALPEIRRLLSDMYSSSEDSLEYEVTGWEIKSLSFMPKTFFKEVFEHSSRMSRREIESNLRSACESGYISDAWAELIPLDTGYVVEYHLVDNPRIREIVFEGATLFSERDLADLVESRKGMILNYATVSADRKILEKLYIRSGYSLVRVNSIFDPGNRRLVFKIDEGRIKNIVLEGNKRTKAWVVTRHVPFNPGDIFKQNKAERGVEDLYGTDLFETVRFLAAPDTTGITLKVLVTEKPYNILRSGARFDLEYGSKAFIDIVDDNLLGAGLELYISTTMGEKRRSVSLDFAADRIWNSLYTYRLFVDYGEFKRNYYIDHKHKGYLSEFHHGGELSLGRQIPRLGTISIVGQIRRYRWDEFDRADRQQFDKGSIGFRSIVDTRDELDFPQSGKYHFFELEFAGELSGDRVAYTRFFTSFESYYRLDGRLNFHPKFSLGISSNFMPFFDQFTLGGQRNFMGLFEDEIVGEKLFLGDLEIRYRVLGPIYLRGRYNMGNIWGKIESIRLSELRYSGGIGMAVKTFVGPVSSWYGRTDEGLDAFYLSVGYNW